MVGVPASAGGVGAAGGATFAGGIVISGAPVLSARELPGPETIAASIAVTATMRMPRRASAELLVAILCYPSPRRPREKMPATTNPAQPSRWHIKAQRDRRYRWRWSTKA
jgi:hypothetical protein